MNDFQIVVAGAPGIDTAYYDSYMNTDIPAQIIFNQTYRLLGHAQAALVTSGTATLETALFKVPQVVCYYIPMGKIISLLRKWFLKVKYISLVNLVANKEVVRELVADEMNVGNIRKELAEVLYDNTSGRIRMLEEYERMIQRLGPAGASHQAASKMVELLNKR